MEVMGNRCESARLILLALSMAACASEDSTYDVLVVGAGAAGLSAADALLNAGVNNSLILEARSYTGGRVHAVPFGSEGLVIEEGANWVHGVPASGGGGLNPIWQLAQQVKLQTTRIPGSCANISGYEIFESDGSPVYRAIERAQQAMKKFDCANSTAATIGNGTDISFTQALTQCGWVNKDNVDLLMQWELGSANDEVSPAELSLKWMLPDQTYSVYGPDDHFVVDQRPRGYAAVLDALIPAATLDQKLKLNSQVEQIALDDSCGGVMVTVVGGRQYCTKHVVVTIPLGAMQRYHSSIFKNPALPAHQAQALNLFTMGNFTKLFLQFPVNFWAARGPQWLAAAEVDVGPGPWWPMEFHNLGSNTLFTYVVGPNAAEWEQMSEKEAIRNLMLRLEGQFGTKLPQPTAFHRTNHSVDPLTIGAYSAIKVGVAMGAMAEMSAPIKYPNGAVVVFAGEHTCANYQGYVHGAYNSGLRAAARVLKAEGMTTKAEAVYHNECGDY